MEPIYIEPGLYVHYKGAIYWLLHTTRWHEDGNQSGHAVYLSQKHMALGPVSRPLFGFVAGDDGWTDQVQWSDGKSRQRFMPARVCLDGGGSYLELEDGTQMVEDAEGALDFR